MDRLAEFWAELRENWDDSYWWADHPELRAAMVGVVAGIVSLMFAYLEARLVLAVRGAE